MAKISRDPTISPRQTIGANHHIPTALVLLLGTMFAPVADRGAPGMGFTHKTGDIVTISTEKLGRLVNRMRPCEECDALDVRRRGADAQSGQAGPDLDAHNRSLVDKLGTEHGRAPELYRRRMGRRRASLATSTRRTQTTLSANMPKPTPHRRTARSRPRKAAFPAWSRTTPQERIDILLQRLDRNSRPQGRARPPAVARGRQDARRRHRRGDPRRRRSSTSSPAKRCGSRREVRLRAAGRRRRGDPRAARRRRHHHAVELPDRDSRLEDRAGAGLRQHASSSSRPTSFPAAPGRSPKSSRRAGLPKGVLNLVMGRGSVVGQAHPRSQGRRRDHLHRLGRRPAARSPPPASRRMRKFQLEMGGKNPLVVLDDADLEDRRRMRGQRRLFLDRPALHRVVAPHRRGGHPRPLRRRAHGADARTLVVDDALKAGTQIGPVVDAERSSSRTSTTSASAKDEGAKLALRRRAAQPRHARLLPRARALHRRRQHRCASRARRSSARSPA